jgi:tetratricopeptide (TPR) repeat protein
MLLAMVTNAQVGRLSTDNKRAIKFYEKGEELISQRNFEEGIESFKRAIDKDPNFSEAFLKLARIYNFLRQLDDSFTYYQQYVEATPLRRIDPRLSLVLADLYFKRGFYDQALIFLTKVEKEAPSLFNTYKEKNLQKSIRFALENQRSGYFGQW